MKEFRLGRWFALPSIAAVPADARQWFASFVQEKVDAVVLASQGPQAPRPPLLSSAFGWEAVNGEGKLVKRIAKFYHKMLGLDIPASVLGDIGARLGEMGVGFTNLRAKIVDTVDWTPGDYGDAKSCFFKESTEYTGAHLHIMEQGGRALLVHKGGKPLARCWLVPPGDDRPFYTLFNGYGLTTPTIARLFAHAAEAEWDTINLYSAVVYINHGLGYVVADPEVLGETTRRSFSLEDDPFGWADAAYECECCGRSFTDPEAMTRIDGYGPVCEACLESSFVACGDCGDWVFDTDATTVATGDAVCEFCLREYYAMCDGCEEWVRAEDIAETKVEDEMWDLCPDCVDGLVRCDRCGKLMFNRPYSSSEWWREVKAPDGSVATFCLDCVPQGQLTFWQEEA